MRKAFCLVGIVTLGATICGCNPGEANKPKPGNMPAQRATTPEAAGDKELALKYLQGIQNGDKKTMYEATNLTEAIVNESREKIVYQSKYNLSEQQRKDFEKSLQISGEIDHILLKLRQNFPKSADLKISAAISMNATATSRGSVYEVQTTYANRDEALRDKAGRPVKEMVVKLRNYTLLANGRWIHEYAFDINDIKVISYF